MLLGDKQKAIKEIGKRKGYVLLDDVLVFYPKRDVILDRMRGLIARGLFKQDLHIRTKQVMGRYIGER